MTHSCKKYGKSLVDGKIRRILTCKYYNCLKPEKISEGCEEELRKAVSTRKKSPNRFNEFEQRKYDVEELKELEGILLRGSVQTGGVKEVFCDS